MKNFLNQRLILTIFICVSFFILFYSCIKNVKKDVQITNISIHKDEQVNSQKLSDMGNTIIHDPNLEMTSPKKRPNSTSTNTSSIEDQPQVNAKKIDPRVAKILSNKPLADLKLFAHIEKSVGQVPPNVYLILEKKKQGASNDEINALIDQYFPVQLTIRNAFKRWLDEK
jgi:hypothetical protein